jgi:hypothetical protein
MTGPSKTSSQPQPKPRTVAEKLAAAQAWQAKIEKVSDLHHHVAPLGR